MSVEYHSCSNASPTYYSFPNMYRTVETCRLGRPSRVGIPSGGEHGGHHNAGVNVFFNHRIMAKLKGLTPAIHRQQAHSYAWTIPCSKILSNFWRSLHQDRGNSICYVFLIKLSRQEGQVIRIFPFPLGTRTRVLQAGHL